MPATTKTTNPSFTQALACAVLRERKRYTSNSRTATISSG
ncbi:Uncharacterised protein [Mycobacteroides abscessus subsp. massiliense]|nr:Uncharacterised protein [Mycobacteroides abscessus subsp. massiliense]